MILGQQPNICTVGEVTKLSMYIEKNRRCTCGELLSECPFWSAIEAKLKEFTGDSDITLADFPRTPYRENQNWDRKFPDIHDFYLLTSQRWMRGIGNAIGGEVAAFTQHAEDTQKLFSIIREHTKSNLIVDSSKEPAVMKHRYLAHNADQFKIIHVVRDGRGIVNSLMHHEKMDLTTATRYWLRRQTNLNMVLASIPQKERYTLRYEDLCKGPKGELEKVGNFVGIDLSDPILTMNKSEFHNIGGSPSRFDQDKSEIALDEKWRNTFSKEDLNAFETIGGDLNKQFGYSK